MAKHEFGIMQAAPEAGQRYDEYEPQKYDRISVGDEHLENIDAKLSQTDFYWHTLAVKGKGLAYCGVTLIPPDSMQAFVAVIGDTPALSELKALLEKAQRENKWVIHFGL